MSDLREWDSYLGADTQEDTQSYGISLTGLLGSPPPEDPALWSNTSAVTVPPVSDDQWFLNMYNQQDRFGAPTGAQEEESAWDKIVNATIEKAATPETVTAAIGFGLKGLADYLTSTKKASIEAQTADKKIMADTNLATHKFNLEQQGKDADKLRARKVYNTSGGRAATFRKGV